MDYSSESSDYEHCTKKSRDEIQVAPQTSGPQTAMARSPQARVAPLGSTSSSTPEVSSIGAATATALRSPSEKRKPPGPTAATAGRRRRRQPPPQQSPSISTMPNSTPTSFSHTQSSQPTSSPRTAPPPSPPHSSDNDDDNDEDRDDYNTALQSFSKKWLSIQLTHKTSASATNTFWKAALESLPKLLELKVEENIRKNVPTFVHQRRKLTGELCPDIHMTYVYRDKRDGSISTATVPKRNEFYEKLYEEAHIKVI